jgi:hypothetical protein
MTVLPWPRQDQRARAVLRDDRAAGPRAGDGLLRRQGEKDAKLAQKLGQLQLFYRRIPT